MQERTFLHAGCQQKVGSYQQYCQQGCGLLDTSEHLVMQQVW